MTDTRPGLRVALSLTENGHLSLPIAVAGVALVLLLLFGSNSGGGNNTAKALRKEWRRDRRKDRRRDKRQRRRQAKRQQRRGVANSGGFEGYDDPVGNALAMLLAAIWRFLVGRELKGRAASNAGFWTFGSRPVRDSLRVRPLPLESGSIGIPEARYLPAIPERPGAAVERWRDWTENHPVPGFSGKAVRHAGAAAVWAGAALVQALRGIGAIGRALRSWGTWPYAFRAVVRLAVVATLAGLWLDRGPTELAVGAAVAGVLGMAATGPAGLGWWHGPKWGDDRTYGPALWAAIRKVLKLEDEEYLEYWMSIPADTRADDAQVRLRLPVEYAGTDIQKAEIDHLVNTRLPGEWVSRWHMMGGDHYAVWTHKPKPKPKPEPPAWVDFFDPEIQDAIAQCERGEVVIGRDEHGRIVTEHLTGATPHWGVSVNTGGGKSAFNLMVIVQLIAQGYHIVIVDVKRVSLSILEGVPGVHIYNDPEAPQDLRKAILWFGEEMKSRSAVLEVAPDMYFPGLLCVIEEATEAQRILRAQWDEIRASKDAASDPIWQQGVMNGVNLGRQMWAHFLFVTQDFRDDTFGGKGLRNGFALKFMGSFNAQQWKNIIGTSPAPESIAKAGRMLIVEGTTQKGWVQTCWSEPDVPAEVTKQRMREWAIQKRREIGFDPEAGLFVAPPERSVKVLPKALRAASRDKLPEAVWAALEGGSKGSVAGDAVTPGSRDAARDALPAGSRDAHQSLADAAARGPLTGVERLLLAARQHAASQAGDATTPRDHDASHGADDYPRRDSNSDTVQSEALFTIAGVSRRLEERGIDISADRIRQAKARDKRTGKNRFPAGTEVEGKHGRTFTLYTESEILEFFNGGDATD
ncbi:MAG: hypothetical protein ACJ786_30240 [Catenulispora sp.]